MLQIAAVYRYNLSCVTISRWYIVSHYILLPYSVCIVFSGSAIVLYCKTLFFHHILISRFPYVENSLHFNLADFPVNFIKQFVYSFFRCLYRILLSKFLSHHCFHNMPTIIHIVSQKCWYAMQMNLCWWAVPKFCVYLISRFYWNCEICEYLMLAKYTCSTVCSTCLRTSNPLTETGPVS